MQKEYDKTLSPEDKGVIDRSSMVLSHLKDKPAYVVGIGASAGGLEALQIFFDNMPSHSGLAFVIVQHLSPDYKSLMVELLFKHTEMKVLRVEDGMTIRPNCVYIIPPKKNMAIHGGNLYLSEQTQRHMLNLPIDIFFRSLAEDQGEKAIGIVLSGTGSDGTRGVRAIKGEGGMVIVQSEESAKFDGMPKSAIATGVADFIVTPEKMPEEILKFISHPHIASKKEPQDIIVKEEDNFSRLFALLRRETNVDFSHYKPSTVVRRIERRMGIVQVNSIGDYIAYIRNQPKEIVSLFKDLLIGVTKFFRENESYKVLKRKVIPKLFENAKARKAKVLRVWVPGCSTGEEAYSLAMVMQSYLDHHKFNIEIKVFATDIDREAIELAGIGLYPDSVAADVEMEYLSKYFEKKKNGYQVKRSIREVVVFALQNLIKDPPFTKIDLISCRNLLIYFQPSIQKKVLSIFNYALLPDGYLFLGASETIGDMASSFDSLDSKHRIYRHRGEGALPLKEAFEMPARHEYTLAAARAVLTDKNEYVPNRRMPENREKYYHSLINKLTSALLVVNENRELIQAFGNPREYLNVPLGNVSLDILMMMPRSLALAVSSAINRVRKEKKEIVYNEIRVKENDMDCVVQLRVDALPEYNSQSQLYIISIEKRSDVDSKELNHEEHPTESLTEHRIRELEQEIQFTRENLQATIEELQTSNEELQATNEELLAANEELQSTNEELQSVNEELNTVNSEYQAKVIELTALNNDMNNLMKSTHIGTIFLDTDLRIRRFTPIITEEINLLDQDIGRPLNDFAHPLFKSSMNDIRNVLNEAIFVEKDVQTDSKYYLLRIFPFKNESDVTEGVVLTLINITKQKRAEKAFEMQSELMKRVIETSPAATIMVNREGDIEFVNKRAEEILGIEREHLLHLTIDSPELGLTDFDGLPISKGKNPLDVIISTQEQIDKMIVYMDKEDHQVVFNITGNPMVNEQKEVDGAVFKFEIIAHQKK